MPTTNTGLRYFAKGSPQAKAHMAKLRAMAAAKRAKAGSGKASYLAASGRCPHCDADVVGSVSYTRSGRCPKCDRIVKNPGNRQGFTVSIASDTVIAGIPLYDILGQYSTLGKAEAAARAASKRTGKHTRVMQTGGNLDLSTFGPKPSGYGMGRGHSRMNPASPQAKRFISRKIPKLIHEGYPQKQAVAIAHSMARKIWYKVNVSAKKLQKVSAPPHFHVQCVGCGKKTRTDRETIYADLKGKAFRDYYCEPCARKVSGYRSGAPLPNVTRAIHPGDPDYNWREADADLFRKGYRYKLAPRSGGDPLYVKTISGIGPLFRKYSADTFDVGWMRADGSVDFCTKGNPSVSGPKGVKSNAQKMMTAEILKRIPKLYSQEKVADPIVHVKFFTPWSNWTWYATEFDGQDQFFGLVVGQETELGYFSLAELSSIRGPGGLRVERDYHFGPTPMSKVKAGVKTNPKRRKNPLTVAESRHVAGTANWEARKAMTLRGVRPQRAAFHAGRADGMVDIINKYGPEFARTKGNPTEAYTGQWFDAGKALWNDLDEREANALVAMLRENDLEAIISIDPDPKKFGAHRFSVYLTKVPTDTYGKVALDGVVNRFTQALSEKRIMRLKDVPGMGHGGGKIYTSVRGGLTSSRKKKGILHRMIEGKVKKNPILQTLMMANPPAKGGHWEVRHYPSDGSEYTLVADPNRRGMVSSFETKKKAEEVFREVGASAVQGYRVVFVHSKRKNGASCNPASCRNPKHKHNAGLHEVHLTSTPAFYTPGILRWAMNGYRFKGDRAKMIQVLVGGYNLPRSVAVGLLSGEIPHKVIGEDVIFSSSWSPKGKIKPNPLVLGKNPLTRREAAAVLRSSRFFAKWAKRDKAVGFLGPQKFAEGAAYGHASVARRFGPKQAGRIAKKIERSVGTASNPARELHPPFKNGQKIPIEKARAWIRSTGNRELLKQFEDALKLQTRANKPPTFVVWRLVPIGSKKKIDAVTAMVHYGDTPETMYTPPKGSKKGRDMYRHKWGEGGGGKRSVPLLAAAGGRALVMPLDGRKVASDWLRH